MRRPKVALEFYFIEHLYFHLYNGSCTDVFSWWKYCIRKYLCGIKKYLRAWKNKTGKDISAFQCVYHICHHICGDTLVLWQWCCGRHDKTYLCTGANTSKEMKNHFLFVNGQLFCPGDLVLILSEVLNEKNGLSNMPNWTEKVKGMFAL